MTGTAGTGTSFDAIEFLAELVATSTHDSVSGARALLLDALRDGLPEGGDWALSPTVDDAGNVLATRGNPHGDGPHVVLNSHLDTVSPGVPLERDADVVRGRGACDAGGPLAALLAAFLAVDPDPTAADSAWASASSSASPSASPAATAEAGALTLAVTPDEETLSRGAHHLVSGDDGAPVPAIAGADAFVVGEPTNGAVCTAAKGRFQGTLALGGVNAHAATPDAGTNAVAALAPALEAIDSFDGRVDTDDADDQLGAPTLVPTVVDGGAATNQVPGEATVVVDRRPPSSETASGFANALESHVSEAVPDGVTVAFALTERDTPFLDTWTTSPGRMIVEAFQMAGAGDTEPFGAATEASYFAARAPTVVFGPGRLADDDGPVAHAPREYVTVDAVDEAIDVLTHALHTLFA